VTKNTCIPTLRLSTIYKVMSITTHTAMYCSTHILAQNTTKGLISTYLVSPLAKNLQASYPDNITTII